MGVDPIASPKYVPGANTVQTYGLGALIFVIFTNKTRIIK